jgi:ubiquinone biosynthesis protein UbiJ
MTRSRASAKQAGTAWETTIVRALIDHGWTHAERRRLASNSDRGDIAGIPGVVIEAKNTNRLDLATAVDEATVEAANDGTPYGVAWIKRKGRTTAEDGYVVMRGETFMALLKEGGW